MTSCTIIPLHMQNVSSGYQIAIITGMLSFGTLNMVVKKIMYQTDGQNIDGGWEAFAKPWWCTLVMFCGESMSIFAYYIIKLSRRGVIPDNDKYIKKDPTSGLGYGRLCLLVLVLSTCDLLQTTLTGIGLIYCPASITQILRGFLMVFVMMFARVFLKRVPKTFQLFGVSSSVFGLVFVGVNAILNTNTQEVSINNVIMGIFLTLGAQVFSSIQFVFEEKFMKGKYDIPSLYLVGCEGIMGVILCAGIFLPAVNFIPGNDHGSYENFANSFYMFSHNPLLLGLNLLYFISISFFNFMAMTISKMLSSTHRAIIDALRTVFVWFIMIMVYYGTMKSCPADGEKPYGEQVNPYSIIELFGFVFMIGGTVIHNNVVGLGAKLVNSTNIGEQEVECCKCDRVKYKKLDEKVVSDEDPSASYTKK